MERHCHHELAICYFGALSRALYHELVLSLPGPERLWNRSASAPIVPMHQLRQSYLGNRYIAHDHITRKKTTSLYTKVNMSSLHTVDIALSLVPTRPCRQVLKQRTAKLRRGTHAATPFACSLQEPSSSVISLEHST